MLLKIATFSDGDYKTVNHTSVSHGRASCNHDLTVPFDLSKEGIVGSM